MEHKEVNNKAESAAPRTSMTELVFILDRSGSMSGLESDTIGGYNSMLAKQRDGAGEVKITTVLFDDQYELLHDRADISTVPFITTKDYYVRGMTALLDAVGKTIHRMVQAQQKDGLERASDNVMFVIITDGQENSSREFKHKQVKQLIEHQKALHGWEFIFLGANIDAVETAEQLGIDEERAVNYHADSEGVQLNFSAISGAVSMFRSAKPMSSEWREEIDTDYKKRGRKKS